MKTMTFQFPGVDETPPLILKILLWTTGISISSALLNNWIEIIFNIPGPQYFLSLSWWGISHFLLWQPLTFLFLETTSGAGITFHFLITLFFEMTLLWIIGSRVYQSVGLPTFRSLYFKGGVFTGLTTMLLLLPFGSYHFIAGATAPIFIIYTVWAFLYPETEILLFFLIPIQAKWTLIGIIGALLLVSLSQLNFTYFLLYLIAFLYGYNYALTVLNLESPFPKLHFFDRFLIRMSKLIRQAIRKSEPLQDFLTKKTKIVEFKKEAPVLDDEAFTDAMLTKISKSGEDSLSLEEKKRLDTISRKKRKN